MYFIPSPGSGTESRSLRPGTVTDRCRLANTTDFMISTGIRKHNPNGDQHPDGITKKPVAAGKAAGIAFQNSPPTFHGIRSLSGRRYEKEKGKKFARKLLGHKSEKRTDKYLDTWEKEYVIL